MQTTKKHPETGETLHLTKRRDSGMNESAYVWTGASGATLDATEEEDAAAIDFYHPTRTINGR